MLKIEQNLHLIAAQAVLEKFDGKTDTELSEKGKRIKAEIEKQGLPKDIEAVYKYLACMELNQLVVPEQEKSLVVICKFKCCSAIIYKLSVKDPEHESKEKSSIKEALEKLDGKEDTELSVKGKRIKAENEKQGLPKDKEAVEKNEAKEIPRVLTLKFRAEDYTGAHEACDGLVVDITKAIEFSMTRAQRWSTFWRHNKEGFFKLFDCVIFAVVFVVVYLAWIFIERFRATQVKYGTIAASVFAAVVTGGKQLFSARNWKQASQFVGDLFKSDKSDQYGQQQTVIQKIKFLKKEIGEKPCSVLSFLAGEKFGSWWGLAEEKIEKTGIPKYGSAPAKKLRIIVFMEGLDRYEDSVLVQVLQSLNTVLKTCKINFVLALEKDIIRKAFKTTSQKDADHFISQIIQLPVTLHPVFPARPPDTSKATSDQMQDNNGTDIENQKKLPSPVKEPVLKLVTRVKKMSEMTDNVHSEEDAIFEKLKPFSREISGIHQNYIKYHKFARNVISQIMGDTYFISEKLDKELVAWIFICSQWRSEMNILIQDWHAYVEVKGQNGEPSLKKIVDNYIANYMEDQADIKGKKKNAADSKENGMEEVDSKEAYKKENGEILNGDIRRWNSLEKAL